MDTKKLRVSSEEIHSLLTEHFQPLVEEHEFQLIKKFQYGRKKCDGIVEIIEFKWGKGGLIFPQWGFSLNYVPRNNGSTLKYHKTLKSAEPDVCYCPLNYTRFSFTRKKWLVSFIEGYDNTERQIKQVSPLVLNESKKLFDNVVNTGDLIKVFKKMKKKRSYELGFYNYISHGLGYALTLKRNGKEAMAKREYDTWEQYMHFNDDLREQYRIMFENA